MLRDSSSLNTHQKHTSLFYLVGGIAVIVLLMVYFYQQLNIPGHDYGYQPIAIALVVLNFVLPYLLMKLIFRIASIHAPEEELHILDVWEQWRHDTRDYWNTHFHRKQ